MKLDNKTLKELLLEGGYISAEDWSVAEEASKKKKTPLVDVLFSEKFITKDILGQAMAESFKVSYADLNSNQPPKEQVLKISEAIAKKYRVILFKESDKNVVVTTDNPSQVGIKEALSTLFKGMKITIAYSLSEDIEENLMHYRKALQSRFAEIIKTKKGLAPEIISEIIKDALSYRASDVHFEPQEKDVVIRFRIDGVLHEAGRISKEHYENVLNRIKVQANLRIDEHASAQDGAIRLRNQAGVGSVDMRVSIIPILDGEKIVIRLLAEYVRGFGLADLGLSARDQKTVLNVAKKPFGMILVTGPTGSGKTTTLYSLLKTRNDPEINITTIEDPVEYKIGGVNQIQVNLATNLTFAKGLRSIMRQDPDIVLVGEIRDQETAEIAVNAALTGHLLFSTFHANDAATTIPRLMDMGIEPFLLSSTLELIVAQRLVRKLCESCRHSYTEKISNLIKLFPEAQNYFTGETVTLYKSKGCPSCGGIGYKGRIAIFELITITQEMSDLILKNPSSGQVRELTKKQGAVSLFKDGISKVRQGITSLDELLRVASPDI